MSAFDLLRLLARLNPQLEDALHPHLPLVAVAAGRADLVTLNPQPLPPLELLRVAVAQTARSVADTAIAVQAGGRQVGPFLAQIADEWCGTTPGTIPWPRRWPRPGPPDPGPLGPEIDRLAPAVQVQAALVFRLYAEAAAGDEELAGAFGALADRLEQAATPSGST